MLWELIVAREISRVLRNFLPVAICFLIYRDIYFSRLFASLKKMFIFYFFPNTSKCPLLKCDRGPGIKLQDFCSFKCIF